MKRIGVTAVLNDSLFSLSNRLEQLLLNTLLILKRILQFLLLLDEVRTLLLQIPESVSQQLIRLLFLGQLEVTLLKEHLLGPQRLLLEDVIRLTV